MFSFVYYLSAFSEKIAEVSAISTAKVSAGEKNQRHHTTNEDLASRVYIIFAAQIDVLITRGLIACAALSAVNTFKFNMSQGIYFNCL